MPVEPFRYPDLLGRLRSQALRRVFTNGRGGQLVFVLVLGVGILALPLAAPLLALGFGAACAVLMVPTIRQGMADPALQRDILAAAIGERFSAADITAPDRRAAIESSVGILTEIALRIHEVERGGRTADRARTAFADASGLVDLQLESARQAESLDRVLAIVARNDGQAGAASAPVGTEDALRQQNIEAVRSEAQAADGLTATIGQRLETILLQMSQLDRETIDLVRADAAVRESGEAVQRLQDTVESRRRAATKLIAVLSTEDEPYASGRRTT
jgi:hypothetical protein